MFFDEDEFRSFLQAFELGNVFFVAIGKSKINFALLFPDPPSRVSVPIWPSSTCSGVNTERFVVGSVYSSC